MSSTPVSHSLKYDWFCKPKYENYSPLCIMHASLNTRTLPTDILGAVMTALVVDATNAVTSIG